MYVPKQEDRRAMRDMKMKLEDTYVALRYHEKSLYAGTYISVARSADRAFLYLPDLLAMHAMRRHYVWNHLTTCDCEVPRIPAPRKGTERSKLS